jgi:DNA-binding beta-propeller fold protein YncE
MTLGMRRVTSNPIDLALGKKGLIYVLCRGMQTEIRRYNTSDEDLGSIGGKGTSEGKFVWPVSIVADEDENLYVSDEATNRISIFRKDGGFLGSWGRFGRKEGEFDRPSGLAFNAQGDLYVADSMNHRVQKFTKDGRFLGMWGGYGIEFGQFDMPWGLSVDHLGAIYVSDWRNDRVQKCDENGGTIMVLGRSDNKDNDLNRPTNIAIDGDGDIYVADWGNDRVLLFNKEGRYVDKFIGDATLSPSGRRYVLANAVTLRLRDLANLAPQKLFRGPMSVKVDANRCLYVADYGSHRIQVYKKECDVLEESDIGPVLKSPTLFTT